MTLARRSDTILVSRLNLSDPDIAYAGVRVAAYDQSGNTQQLYADVDGAPGGTVASVVTDENGAYAFWTEEGLITLRYSFGSSILGDEAVAIGNLFIRGRETPVAGSKMKIDWLFDGATPLENEAGIWGGPVYTRRGLSWDFTASDGSGANAPSASMFMRAVNNGSASDACGFISVGLAKQNTGAVFGGNIIVRNEAGVNGSRLKGLEVDWEPASGTTVDSSSAALIINAFSTTCPKGIHFGGNAFGGSYTNLILLSANVDGSIIAPDGAVAIGSIIDSGTAVYGESSPIKLRNGHKLAMYNPDGNAAGRVYCDAAGNVRFASAGGVVAFRNAGDTVSTMSIDDSGNVDAMASYRVAGTKVVGARGASVTGPTGGATVDTEARTAINAIISRLQAHGLIA